jgi:hypothetical protein
MTIPGIGAITALALVAVIGDVTRFPSPRHLVGYLGLDPRVRQSGERAARHGHISRAGQAHARGLLVGAAHVAIRTPGPLHAFHVRIAARRSKQIALCATARKLAVLARHLLSKDEDYRYGAPTITQRKLRSLRRKAGDTGPRISLAGESRRRVLERRFLEEAERRLQGPKGAGPCCSSWGSAVWNRAWPAPGWGGLLIAKYRGFPARCRAATGPAEGMFLGARWEGGVIRCGRWPRQAGQFARDGDGDDRASLVAGLEAVPGTVQALLGAGGDRDRFGGLAGLAVGEGFADAWSGPVFPGGFDEQAAGVTGAGLCDRALAAALAGGVF